MGDMVIGVFGDGVVFDVIVVVVYECGFGFGVFIMDEV